VNNREERLARAAAQIGPIAKRLGQLAVIARRMNAVNRALRREPVVLVSNGPLPSDPQAAVDQMRRDVERLEAAAPKFPNR
jgi:hypothetical protein